MYGAGLVGTGGIFVEHWRAYANLDDRVRVVGAADIDEAKLRQASERCFVPLTFTDHRELLARDDVDIVSICTPPKFHEHLVNDALEAGKFVICEKPLAQNLETADRIIAAAERFPNRLAVVAQLRYREAVQKARILLDDGRIGTPLSGRFSRNGGLNLKSSSGNWWGNWDVSGGGVGLTQFIHEFDSMLYLFGKAVSVMAMMDTLKQPIESEDTFSAVVRFASGAIVSCSSTVNAVRPATTFEVVAENGVMRLPWQLESSAADMLQGVLGAKYSEPPRKGPSNSLPARIWRKGLRTLKLGGVPNFGPPESSHTPFVKACLDAMDADGPVPVTPMEGRNALELCHAIYESALTGQPVTLPLSSDAMVFQGVTPETYQQAKSKWPRRGASEG